MHLLLLTLALLISAISPAFLESSSSSRQTQHQTNVKKTTNLQLPSLPSTHSNLTIPNNWPPTPWTYQHRPIAIRFDTYGRRVARPDLREAVLSDLADIVEIFYRSREEYADDDTFSFAKGVVHLTVTPTGDTELGGFEIAQTLETVLEMMKLGGWDVIEIVRGEIFLFEEPNTMAGIFGLVYSGFRA